MEHFQFILIFCFLSAVRLREVVDLVRPSESLEHGHLGFKIGTVQDGCGAIAVESCFNLDLVSNAIS